MRSLQEIEHEVAQALDDEAAAYQSRDSATGPRPTHGVLPRSAAVRARAPCVGAPLKSLIDWAGRSIHRAS